MAPARLVDLQGTVDQKRQPPFASVVRVCNAAIQNERALATVAWTGYEFIDRVILFFGMAISDSHGEIALVRDLS